jgi:hypothetical protein
MKFPPISLPQVSSSCCTAPHALLTRIASGSIGPSRPPPYFKSTEDLLSKFQLLSAYNSYVRPFQSLEDTPSDTVKGTPIDPDDDELDRGKKKNSYKHLIKGIPGSITSCVSFQQSTFAHSPRRKTLDQKGRLSDHHHENTTKANRQHRPI